MGLRKRAHRAGVSVRALKPEKAVETAMVRANCLYKAPVIPLMKAVGINTESRTSTSPTTGPVSSFIAFSAACTRLRTPFDTSRAQSSTTTMASSTTMAMASTRPKSVSVLSEKPIIFITANVPMSDTGMVSIGMMTALQFWRKIRMTIITMSVVSQKVITTSSMDSCT